MSDDDFRYMLTNDMGLIFDEISLYEEESALDWAKKRDGRYFLNKMGPDGPIKVWCFDAYGSHLVMDLTEPTDSFTITATVRKSGDSLALNLTRQLRSIGVGVGDTVLVHVERV